MMIICSRSKPSREAAQGLLRPLPIAVSKEWGGVEYNSMFVVVDRMSKQVHITPCNGLTTRNTAYMFYRDCFRPHGLLDSIVSDRGSQFTAEFWKWLCKLLQIDHRLSTVFHPQTDGQTDRMNSRIGQHLRAYVNFAQNNWVHFLPMVEFALKNHDSQVTSVSPFLACYGLNPRSGCDLSSPLHGTLGPASIPFDRRVPEDLVSKFKEIDKFITDNILLHSAEHEEQANESRTAARDFRPGDKVWLNYNIKLLRPIHKLDFKKGGPFKVIESVGNYAYKLELPSSAKIHPVFHVSLLSPVANDPLPGQTSELGLVLDAEDDTHEYEIERIIGTQWIDGKLNYIVRRKGYGPQDDWVILASESQNFKELVTEFH